MKQEELKPCPFCGRRNIGYGEDSNRGLLYCCFILCLDCLSRGPSACDKETAIKKWNEVKR